MPEQSGIYLFESPDNGITVYRRKFMETQRELVSIDGVQTQDIDWLERDVYSKNRQKMKPMCKNELEKDGKSAG
jgi:hypothetical protein